MQLHTSLHAALEEHLKRKQLPINEQMGMFT